jgi:acyl-CoA reductase-like NAD-dependent aldehyde dehydrogenase
MIDLHDKSLFRRAAFVNGGWIEAGAAGDFELRDPANGALIAHIPQLNRAQVSAAIDARAYCAGGTI